MRVTALAGGIGGARFLLGVRHALPDAAITVIGNVGDDITLHGLRICPDLDTVMYTLGGGISTERGWGRQDETFHAFGELKAYGVGPDWFNLGDRDIGTHLVRTRMLAAGYPLSQVTAALCDRWSPGVTLIPASDDRVETHVVVADGGGRRAVHFQEWWLGMGARVPALAFVPVNADEAKPAPGVVDALADADVVLLPPSNPVVSIGAILAVPGIREALVASTAPVVGVSPIVGGAPVRGMADACLAAIGVPTTAAAVGAHYGARARAGARADDAATAGGGGLLDGWLVDTADAGAEVPGVAVVARPLMMTDVDATAAIVRAALELAGV